MLIVNVIALILVIIGALNWGLVGFFNYNFVSVIFGGMPGGDYTGLERVVYAIVGLAGIWALSFLGRLGALCSDKCKDSSCGSDKDNGSCSHHHDKHDH